MAELLRDHPELAIPFSTIHPAKGAEADVVILLNMKGGTRGFPSGVQDDPLMQLILGETDAYPDAEERRLLYVALTRAHRALHVYVPLRYHHRPKGRDDAHSFGQPSRFLSAKVRSHFDESAVVHGEVATWEPVDAAAVVGGQLDALWGR